MNQDVVILHLYYDDLWDEIQSYLHHLTDFDLYISIHPKTSQVVIERIRRVYPNAQFRVFHNAGRDIRPFIYIYDEIKSLDYRYICKIHTKKSLLYPLEHGPKHRKMLLDSTLLMADEARSKLNQNPKLGMVGCSETMLRLDNHLYNNLPYLGYLIHRLNYRFDKSEFFIAGTMFWVRHRLFDDIVELGKTLTFWPEEEKMDGTLAHAYERLFAISMYNKGFKVEGLK